MNNTTDRGVSPELEKVARALRPFFSGADIMDGEPEAAARAALQELREPTEGMKEAGAAVGIFHPYEAEVLPFAPDEAGAIFTAVLDHVLGEPK